MFLEQSPDVARRHICCWRSHATPEPPNHATTTYHTQENPCLHSPQPPSSPIHASAAARLKKALEARWAGRISDAALLDAQAQLRKTNLARLVELGLGASDASLADAPSLYDQVLDITLLLGAVPERFRGREGLDLYFALARGDAGVAPQEMTKWFDTNYHYLVPEIGPQTPISLTDNTIVRQFTDALSWGYVTRPVLVGPVTYLALAKASTDAPKGFDPLSRMTRSWPPTRTCCVHSPQPAPHGCSSTNPPSSRTTSGTHAQSWLRQQDERIGLLLGRRLEWSGPRSS